MYTKMIPHKNFAGKPRNQEVNFNLTEHEVLKLLPEFQSIFSWTEMVSKADPDAETPTEEVMEFYNNFETILLAAWGELSDDGDHFRKGGVYEFRESSVFHAAMKMFLEDITELNRLIDGLMPKGLQDLVKSVDKNVAELAQMDDPAAQAEVERLRRQLEAAEARTNSASE